MSLIVKKIFLLVLASFFTLVPLANAQNEVFFEFAPDPWRSERLTISSQVPYQLFQPNVDALLTGFDFWMDNSGASNQITFTLANSNNTTLAVKTITLPTLSPTAGGHKVHVDLTNPTQLSAGQTYSIKISAPAANIGLYYANRLNFLEHNEPYQSEFTQGAAKLDQELQLFTFKLALYRPAPDTSSQTQDEEQNEPPNATTTIAITNARVANLTPTSALIAWTTNIATDSRVTLRTQLNPYIIDQTAYDPTLELEHALLLTNLTPTANYFADTYSSLGENVVLTTYTLGFQTPAQPIESNDPDPNPNPDPNQDSDQADTDQGSDQTDSTTSQTTSDSSSNTLPPTNISTNNITKKTTISWDSPTNGQSINGYRIDIFDSNYNLERQIILDPSENEKNIPQLSSGTHNVVIYADNEGVYTKVAAPENFLVRANGATIFWKIIAVILLWLIGLGSYFYWKFKHAKSVLPPEKGYDPNA